MIGSIHENTLGALLILLRRLEVVLWYNHRKTEKHRRSLTNSCNTTLDGLMPIELVPCCCALEACVSIDLSDSKASQDQFFVEANRRGLFRYIYAPYDNFNVLTGTLTFMFHLLSVCLSIICYNMYEIGKYKQHFT